MSIKVFAPATVANVACGFDIFGFALLNPGDEVIASLKNSPGVTLNVQGDDNRLPTDPNKNTAGVSALRLLEHLNTKQGIELNLLKKMPLGSGLGSSAASAVASLFAVNTLLGNPFSTQDLLPFAMEGERVACGSAHADNVAPCLLGGFILIRCYSPLEVIKIPIQMDLFCTVLHPNIEIRTQDARNIIPKDVNFQQHITQTGNAAGLIAALMLGNVNLLQNCLQDVIVEPVRSTLIPGFKAIKSAALKAGALGCSISGSGPSLFALSSNESQAQNIALAMQEACTAEGVESNFYISPLNLEGPKIL